MQLFASVTLYNIVNLTDIESGQNSIPNAVKSTSAVPQSKKLECSVKSRCEQVFSKTPYFSFHLKREKISEGCDFLKHIENPLRRQFFDYRKV